MMDRIPLFDTDVTQMFSPKHLCNYMGLHVPDNYSRTRP